jgi:hypothetical protein
MNYTIELEQSIFGTKAVIKGIWKDSYLNFLLENEVQELELNDGKGWIGQNLEFLKDLPDLKSIIIIDLKIISIEPIHYLKELVSLKVITYSKNPINFKSFPKLVECGFEWIKGSESLFEMSNLKKLFINRYNKNNSDVFSKLVNLESLSILNSQIENLLGISSLRKLQNLRLGNLKKISTLQGLENLKDLETLEIQKCKGILDVSVIFNLTKLKQLFLIDMGNISSINGIENLTSLNEFLFYESTNISDGDLIPLKNLPSLRKISFHNRKHYTLKREDFVSGL